MKKIKPNLQNGLVAVEFALVLPVFLLLLFGIIEFGIMIYDEMIITNASREGARAAAVMSANPAYQPAANFISAFQNQANTVSQSYCNNNLITFGSSGSPSVTFPSPNAPATSSTAINVTISYNYQGLGILSMIGLSKQLNASTQMYYE